MCGIAVAVDWPDSEGVVRLLIDGVLHRGDVTDPVFSPRPDSIMCTRRLRIVDAERAVQPQISFNGRIAVCCNGEIYNYRELRRELQAAGIVFKTESDTEVLANALQAWGPAALERFVGMYAFVAIDTATGDFLAARDPFGVKPLYVIQAERGFLFCSEMRPLLDTIPDADVLLLPPGYLLARDGCMRFRSPLRTAPSIVPSLGDARTLDALLAEAVRIRIPDGLPVATLFSGGIDSTLVAHYTRRFRPEAPGYFVGGAASPDYRYAAEYAERSGFDLRTVPFDPDSDATFALIGGVVEATESFEPNLVRDAVCSLMVSQQIHSDGIRVALCGDGADELFCGYPPLEIAFQDTPAAGQAIRGECLALMHRVSLQRVDRCSMRHQVETREPFLDPSVANYALDLDTSALVRDDGGCARGKAVLREIFNLYPDQLPAAIRDRSKVPFGEGAGLCASPEHSGWKQRFNAAISDRDLADGRKEFEAFRIQTREELYYIRKLAQTIDINRVPHLRDRAWISFPVGRYLEKLKAYAHFSL
ncbi:MAG TPA: asparagine synthase-related protein [Pseudolabrys sp.]|nr:asparagine synthase-related protein [Pseudolabrys sp.]